MSKVQAYTDMNVRNLKPRKTRYEDKVAGFPGLRVVVQPNGTKAFVLRYSYGKKYRKLTLNAYQPNTGALATAQEHYRDAIAALNRGENPADAVRKRRSGNVDADDTVTAYVEMFKQQRFSKLAVGTADYYATELDRLVDAFGATDIAKVTPKDVQKVIDKAIDRGDAAQRTTYKVARAFFNWASPRAGVDSPCEKIAAPSKDTERKRWLDDAEIKVVWKAAETAGGAPGALVKLLLLTGCRRDEICYLRRDQIRDNRIVFPESLTKNNEPHSVPITPAIRRALDTLPDKSEYALTGNGAGLGGHSKARAAIKTPSLEHWTFHDLRRSFASGLARLGVPLQVTELCLNHKSGVSNRPLIRIYQQHDFAKEVKAAFEKWSAHVESLIAEKVKAAA